MKVSMKELLNKLLNWSGLKYIWDVGINNTTDTWIPVFSGNTIHHRVLPSNANSSVSKYGSVWTSGSISLYRRGNTVQVTGDPTFSATSARTRIGTIPSGYIPSQTAYAHINGEVDYLLFNTDGSVQINSRGAGQVWFSGVWVVNS